MYNPDITAFLDEIKEYRENNVVSWNDYEYFKQVFYSHNIFGYERDIADALGL